MITYYRILLGESATEVRSRGEIEYTTLEAIHARGMAVVVLKNSSKKQRKSSARRGRPKVRPTSLRTNLDATFIFYLRRTDLCLKRLYKIETVTCKKKSSRSLNPEVDLAVNWK